MSTPPEDPYAHLFRDPAPSTPAASNDRPEPEALPDSIPEPEWLASDELVVSHEAPIEPADEPEVIDEVEVAEQEIVEQEIVEQEVVEDSPDQMSSDDVSNDGVIADASPAREAAAPRTGRLFRSTGAPDDTEALLAVPTSQASKLRTLKQGDQAPAAPVVIGALPVVVEDVVVEREPARSPLRRRESRVDEASEHRGPRTGSLTAIGAYVIVIAVTVILALGSALIFGQAMGILTGVGLIATSVFSALAIRRNDDINAIFAPPIAYFLTIVTAGQIGLNVQSFSGRLVEIFFLMGTNWIWLAASVLAALIIVALRRRAA